MATQRGSCSAMRRLIRMKCSSEGAASIRSRPLSRCGARWMLTVARSRVMSWEFSLKEINRARSPRRQAASMKTPGSIDLPAPELAVTKAFVPR